MREADDRRDAALTAHFGEADAPARAAKSPAIRPATLAP
jgi:hypothetical protein